MGGCDRHGCRIPAGRGESDAGTGLPRYLRPAYPAGQSASRFLAALQLELDPELGRRPAGRPAEPRCLRAAVAVGSGGADPAHRPTARPQGGPTRPAREPASRRGRPAGPEGRPVVAPGTSYLDPLSATDFVSEKWLEDVLAGTIEPRPSSVGFLDEPDRCNSRVSNGPQRRVPHRGCSSARRALATGVCARHASGPQHPCAPGASGSSTRRASLAQTQPETQPEPSAGRRGSLFIRHASRTRNLWYHGVEPSSAANAAGDVRLPPTGPMIRGIPSSGYGGRITHRHGNDLMGDVETVYPQGDVSTSDEP